MTKKITAEAEVKFSVNKNKYSSLPQLLEKKGFSFKKAELISDYFKEIEKSDFGWSFKRLRLVDNKEYLITIKKWSLDKKGHKVRIEDEHKITKSSFKSFTSQGVEAELTKNRSDFTGVIDGLKTTVSLDLIDINGGIKYFIECEVLTTIDKSYEVRKKLTKWLTKELNITTKKEAPSMLDLLQKSNRLIKYKD